MITLDLFGDSEDILVTACIDKTIDEKDEKTSSKLDVFCPELELQLVEVEF